MHNLVPLKTFLFGILPCAAIPSIANADLLSWDADTNFTNGTVGGVSLSLGNGATLTMSRLTLAPGANLSLQVGRTATGTTIGGDVSDHAGWHFRALYANWKNEDAACQAKTAQAEPIE